MFILMVDDDLDDCGFFTEIVGEIDSSSTVVSVHDGIDALNYLEAQTVLPDIVFLDINMPRMNGKQLFLIMQKDERFQSIPVIIYSTSIPDREARYYQSYGATTLVKPSTYQSLKEALSEIILNEMKM